MDFRATENNGYVIVSMEGQVRISTQNDFLDYMNQMFDSYGSKPVLLDMEKVSYMNSAGIGIVVDTFKKFRDNEGRMVLCNLIPDISKLFEVTKLNRFIEIYPSVDDAIHKLSLQK